MRKLISLILLLLTLTGAALACDQTIPADPDQIAQLLPGYTLVDSVDEGDVLRLLMRNPADELVFVGGVLGEDGWRFTESTPLPEGVPLGHALWLPSGTFFDTVYLRPYADGTWGIFEIHPNGGGMFNLWKYVISDEPFGEVYGPIGDHPWSDITVIEWASLPDSYEAALAQLDTTNWAVVNNPDPADRLHLRVSPDSDAASLGKYYNRTPVRIREYGETWCAVTVCGLDGWMMTDYLAFGADMDAVKYAGPWLSWKEGMTEFRLYDTPRASGNYTARFAPECWHNFTIMGVAGDFYHVWLPDTEEYGYIRMDDLWEGNG